MVKLSLIVEGGVFPDNVSAQTANNVESLRQSLHALFTRLLKRDDVEITVYLGSGYRQAAMKCVEQTPPMALFVDSDMPAEIKHRWFEKLINKEHPEKSIIIPDDKIQYVFFMVQEMEAWFLKQPDCMERWALAEGYLRKDADADIASHSLIRDKDIESIAKPSEKVAILLKRFFYKGKKAARYGKLRTAPALLDTLDIDALVPMDTELQRFMALMQQVREG